MVIVLIIVAVILLFFITMVILGHKRRNMVASNPIDGLHFGGTMGFLLGDSYDFCKSRLAHLNITPDSDDMDNEVHQLLMGGFGSYVYFGSKMYNNVNDVSFKFDNKKLSCVTIDIDYTSLGLTEMYKFLQNRMTIILKKQPEIATKDFSKWCSNRGNITLSIFKEKDGDQLVIHVLND